MPGFLHLYVGQEAVAAGVMSMLRDTDQITSTHRGHGHAVAKGAQFRPMFAELFGKSTGYCRGRGGSMHINDLDIGMLGANGIVGAGIPIAVGAAFASAYRGDGSVAAAFFGDGGSNIGTLPRGGQHGRRPASCRSCFVCENNGYAEFTPQSKHMLLKDVADRAAVVRHARRDRATAWTSLARPRGHQPRRSSGPAAGGGPTLDRGQDLPLLRPPGRQGAAHPTAPRRRSRTWQRARRRSRPARAAVEAGLVDARRSSTTSGTKYTADAAEAIEFARQSPMPDAEGFRSQCLQHSTDTAPPRHGHLGRDRTQLTYVKAFNEGLIQVMREDEDVFLIGEDVAGYGGVFHMFDGLLQRVRRAPGHRHPDLRSGARRPRRGRRGDRPASGRRPHVHGLPRRLHGPGRQPGRQDEVHVRRRRCGAADHHHGRGRRASAPRRSTARASRRGLRTFPGSRSSCRRRRTTPRASSSRPSATTTRSCHAATRCCSAARATCPRSSTRSRSARPRPRATGADVTIVALGRMVHEALDRSGRARRGGHRASRSSTRAPSSRSTRTTIVESARSTNRVLVVHEAVQFGGHRRRDRRPDPGRGVRLPRRAGRRGSARRSRRCRSARRWRRLRARPRPRSPPARARCWRGAEPMAVEILLPKLGLTMTEGDDRRVARRGRARASTSATRSCGSPPTRSTSTSRPRASGCSTRTSKPAPPCRRVRWSGGCSADGEQPPAAGRCPRPPPSRPSRSPRPQRWPRPRRSSLGARASGSRRRRTRAAWRRSCQIDIATVRGTGPGGRMVRRTSRNTPQPRWSPSPRSTAAPG